VPKAHNREGEQKVKPDPNRLPSGEYPDTSTAAFTNTIPVVDSSTFPDFASENTLIRTERLPFTIRAVTAPPDLARVVNLRKFSYGRHLPEFSKRLEQPETDDTRDNTIILLAESKFDRTALATMRIHVNIGAPLPLEQAVSLPKRLQNQVLAEAVRLALVPGHEGHLPRDAIFKAFYLVCLALNVDWMVICARHPLFKRYLGMYFEDVLENKTMVPLPYAGNIPHRVLSFDVNNAEHLWRTGRQPLYNFVFKTYHPDIEDFSVSCRDLAQRISKTRTKQKTLALAY